MEPIYNGKNPFQNQLVKTVQACLDPEMEMVAVNFSKTTHSTYWLIQNGEGKSTKWLTLRIAFHPLWLQNANQLEVAWDEDSADFEALRQLLTAKLIPENIAKHEFIIDESQAATLLLLTQFERHNLVILLKLTEKIARGHKEILLDLNDEFLKLPLMLGDRNNVNKFRNKIDLPKFHQAIAKFYGENFLFSQFTVHNFMKLLPTNQWMKPIFAQFPNLLDWRPVLCQTYGAEFVKKSQRAIDIETGKEVE